jgi:hypothetical protein
VIDLLPRLKPCRGIPFAVGILVIPHPTANSLPSRGLWFAGSGLAPSGVWCVRHCRPSPLPATIAPRDCSASRPRVGPSTQRSATPCGSACQAGAGLLCDYPRGRRGRLRRNGVGAFRPTGRPQPNCHGFAVLLIFLYGCRESKVEGCSQSVTVEQSAVMSLQPTAQAVSWASARDVSVVAGFGLPGVLSTLRGFPEAARRTSLFLQMV